jgi:hypothetical protein
MYSGEYDACGVALSGLVFHRGRRFDSPAWPGIFFKLARCGYTLRVVVQASLFQYIKINRKIREYTIGRL